VHINNRVIAFSLCLLVALNDSVYDSDETLTPHSNNKTTVFTISVCSSARCNMYCYAAISIGRITCPVRPSVCPSVCLSHAGS